MHLPRACCLAVGLSLAMLGCKAGPSGQCAPRAPSPVPIAAQPQTATLAPAADASKSIPVTAVSFQEPLPQPSPETSFAAPQELVGVVLSREWLQAEIEARNPSLEAMIAAWQAAAQVYPQ